MFPRSYVFVTFPKVQYFCIIFLEKRPPYTTSSRLYKLQVPENLDLLLIRNSYFSKF